MREIERLRAQNKILRDALDRLGSMRCFDIPRMLTNKDTELRARIDYAREQLEAADEVVS